MNNFLEQILRYNSLTVQLKVRSQIKREKLMRNYSLNLRKILTPRLKSKVTADFKAKRSHWNRKAYKERLKESAKEEKLFSHNTRNGNITNPHGTTNSKTNCKLNPMANNFPPDSSEDADTSSQGQKNKYFFHPSHSTSAKNCNSNWQTPPP